MKWFHQLLVVLLAAAWLLVLAAFSLKLNVPGRSGWPEAVLLVLATAGTLTMLSRRLPFQNVLLAASGIALIGGGMHALNLTLSIPFGPMMFGTALGPRIFDALPWPVPLILRPWRKTGAHGFWLAGVTVGMTVLFDFALEPFASRIQHYWLWEPTKFPVTWQSAPVIDFIGWAVISLLILVLITPWLINKKPVRKRPPDLHPFGVWIGAVILFAVAAATHQMWSVVAVDAVIGIVATALVIRGARW